MKPQDMISYVRAANKANFLVRVHWYRDNMRFCRFNHMVYNKTLDFADQDHLSSLQFRCNKIIDKIENAYLDARLKNRVRDKIRIVVDTCLIVVHYEDDNDDTYTTVFVFKPADF